MLIGVFIVTGWVGCATAKSTLYPKENNEGQIVALSESESSALSAAKRKGQDYCKIQQKRLELLGQRTKLQSAGLDSGDKEIYRVTVDFKCL